MRDQRLQRPQHPNCVPCLAFVATILVTEVARTQIEEALEKMGLRPEARVLY